MIFEDLAVSVLGSNVAALSEPRVGLSILVANVSAGVIANFIYDRYPPFFERMRNRWVKRHEAKKAKKAARRATFFTRSNYRK